MSDGKMVYRIEIGVYTPNEIVVPTVDRWIFENGDGVLFENNDNLIV